MVYLYSSIELGQLVYVTIIILFDGLILQSEFGGPSQFNDFTIISFKQDFHFHLPLALPSFVNLTSLSIKPKPQSSPLQLSQFPSDDHIGAISEDQPDAWTSNATINLPTPLSKDLPAILPTLLWDGSFPITPPTVNNLSGGMIELEATD